MKIFILKILFLLSLAQLNAQITIDPNMPKNVNSKIGYYLIFEDEFDGPVLNPFKWDKGSAMPQDDVDCNKYLIDAMEDQVQVIGGMCRI